MFDFARTAGVFQNRKVANQGIYHPLLDTLCLTHVALFQLPKSHALPLGFSPVVNGITNTKTHQDQGFADSIANGGVDPINVFPLAPNNDDSSLSNNYSPLWDAHVNMWTPAAMRSGKVRRITSLPDLRRLVKAGLVTSADINPPGPGNPFIAGLRPTKAIINCPVIAQPLLPPQ